MVTKKICKVCTRFEEVYKVSKDVNGFICQLCKKERDTLNLNATTHVVKKLIERIEYLENAMAEKLYEVVIDIQPLADQLGMTKQRCAELLADECMRILLPIPSSPYTPTGE